MYLHPSSTSSVFTFSSSFRRRKKQRKKEEEFLKTSRLSRRKSIRNAQTSSSNPSPFLRHKRIFTKNTPSLYLSSFLSHCRLENSSDHMEEKGGQGDDLRQPFPVYNNHSRRGVLCSRPVENHPASSHCTYIYICIYIFFFPSFRSSLSAFSLRTDSHIHTHKHTNTHTQCSPRPFVPPALCLIFSLSLSLLLFLFSLTLPVPFDSPSSLRGESPYHVPSPHSVPPPSLHLSPSFSLEPSSLLCAPHAFPLFLSRSLRRYGGRDTVGPSERAIATRWGWLSPVLRGAHQSTRSHGSASTVCSSRSRDSYIRNGTALFLPVFK